MNKLSDAQLLKEFHSYPIKSLIANAIVSVIFVMAFFAENFFADGYGLAYMFAIGALAVVAVQWLFPAGTRKNIAKIMKERHKKAEDKETKAIYYLRRREFQLYGKVNQSKSEKVINSFAMVFVVINYLFYILASLLALAFGLIIAVILGGFLYIAYIIFGAGSSNGLARAALRGAKLSCVPLKLAFKFFKSVLSFKIFKTAIDGENTVFKFMTQQGGLSNHRSVQEKLENNKYTGDALASDGKNISRELSELYLDDYFPASAESIYSSLPVGAKFSSVKCDIAFNSVNYEATIMFDEKVYETQSVVDVQVDLFTANVSSEIDKIIDRFLRNFPNAQKANVNVKVCGYLVEF